MSLVRTGGGDWHSGVGEGLRVFRQLASPAVVNELHKMLVPRPWPVRVWQGRTIKRDIPYSALAQAFRASFVPVSAKSEGRVEHTGERCGREALGAERDCEG